jgi:rhodanese-related sulfurtransferase
MMNKKVTIISISVIIIFISFVVIYTNKSVAKNEDMDGMPGMSESEMENQKVHKINQENVLKEIKNTDVTIVDLREPSLYQKGHIPNSINIPFEDFQNRYKELDPNKNIILICHVGSMGEASGQFLLEKEFQHVSNLSGGIAQWTGPIEQ